MTIRGITFQILPTIESLQAGETAYVSHSDVIFKHPDENGDSQIFIEKTARISPRPTTLGPRGKLASLSGLECIEFDVQVRKTRFGSEFSLDFSRVKKSAVNTRQYIGGAFPVGTVNIKRLNAQNKPRQKRK